MQFEIFYNLLTLPPTVSNMYTYVARRNHVQITCNTSGSHHMQHVVCHMVRRDSPAIKFEIVEITFILALFYWLNH